MFWNSPLAPDPWPRSGVGFASKNDSKKGRIVQPDVVIVLQTMRFLFFRLLQSSLWKQLAIDFMLSHHESHLQSESAQERNVERKSKLQAAKCKTYDEYL